MAAERIIGVDFGTSTSVIRVKRYQDGKPLGDPLEVKQVTFNMGNSMVPTLVQKRESGETVFFGHEASIARRGNNTLANFKVDLESPDAEVRRQARALTKEFFAYMAKTYREQSEGGHLGESSDRERTIISYPVKWSDETKAFMVETAKEAGFPNVEGLDEARAAIQAVTVQNADMLTKKGYFKAGEPVNILLIDMGAGTTDLVLCRHTPGTKPKTEILATWPQEGKALFGGREADQLLRKIICDSVGETIAGRMADETFKAWKETMVSPALRRNEIVEEFSALDLLMDTLRIEASYLISRESFEEAGANYLRAFPALVNGCLQAGKLSGNEVDLVILTGGHSQWYFVQEMLLGKMKRFGNIALGRVQQEPDRIVPIALPQETVALGLVYGKLAPIVDRAKEKKAPVVEPLKAPNVTVRATPAPQSMSMPIAEGGIVEARAAMRAKAHGAAIASSSCHTVGLRSDGTVVATGDNQCGQCNVSSWYDIIAVAVGNRHTVGLRRDGTVVAVGNNSITKSGLFRDRRRHGRIETGQCNVNNWHDIIAIAAGDTHTVGLRSDGTVVATGDNQCGQCNVSDWHNIIDVKAFGSHTVGLRSDGTVVSTEYSRGCDIFRDIIDVAVGGLGIAGLKSDGTVVSSGHYELGADELHDIISVAVGQNIILCLKSDGTVKIFGNDKWVENYLEGFENTKMKYVDIIESDWHDIISVAAGTGCFDDVLGIKNDGIVVFAGESINLSRGDVPSWKLF